MPLPDAFNPSEHFQDVARKIYNDEVRDHFPDLNTQALDIAGSRDSIKTACTHQPNDPIILTVGRMQLFDMVIGQRWRALANRTGGSAPPIAAIRRGKPKITLYFLEDDEDIDPQFGPVDGQISFRLMDETATTLTEANLRTIANQIKTKFGSATAQVWKKGRYSASYTDWEEGFQLQLLVKDKAEAKDLVNRVLDLRSKTPDWARFNFSENEDPGEAYAYNPGSVSVLGKSRKIRRRRPITTVRLQHAECEIEGLPNPVIIFDRSGVYPDALVRTY